MSVTLRGDALEAMHPEAQVPLLLADEPRWVVDTADPYTPAPVLSPDDVGPDPAGRITTLSGHPVRMGEGFQSSEDRTPLGFHWNAFVRSPRAIGHRAGRS